MAHKDLSESERATVEHVAHRTALDLFVCKQSLALAREAWINAFDKAAEELEADDGDA